MSSSRTGSSSGRKKPAFLTAGQQGCVYDGEFGVIRGKTEGCVAVPGSMVQPRMITKIMKDKEVYNKEIAAARVLVNEDPDMRVAVYATRGCTIKIQDVLNEDDIEHCNEKKDINKDKLIKTDTGYSIEMPYVRHRTLQQMPPNSIRLNTGIRLFKQLENFIRTLQSWGIYHSDLHDDNVWVVGYDGNEDHYSLKIADFGCAVVNVPEEQKSVKAKDDIRTSAPSFKKLFEMISNRPRELKPDSIGQYIKGMGQFYGWATLEDTLKQYMKPQEPEEALAFAEPSGKRLRFGSPPGLQLGSPPAKKNLMSMFD